MIRGMIVVSILVAGLLIAGLSQASSAVIETQHLIVSDATGKLSNDQLKSLADQAQAMLGRILAFWSADSGVDRFGKDTGRFRCTTQGCLFQCLLLGKKGWWTYTHRSGLQI